MERSISIASVEHCKTLMHCTTEHIKTAVQDALIDIDIDDEFQFVRQQWSTTTKTENFWYIDSDHILELTDSEFVLHTKTTEVDDWNGDIWEHTVLKDRSDVLTSNIIKYLGTCAYNDAPQFITFEATDSATVRIVAYNMLTMQKVSSQNIRIRVVPLGQVLSDGISICTYKNIDAQYLISNAKLSATVTRNILMVGIAIDRGLQQWAIIGSKVLTGYGHVGYDGTLTGGEIPTNYFNTSVGFNGTVYSIDQLSKFTTRDISGNWSDSIIVGDSDTQWYIQKEVSSIVSHVQYVGGKHKLIELKLNNNYAASYTSPSFNVNKLVNIYPLATTLVDLFPMPNGVSKSVRVLSRIFTPSIWYYVPTWVKFSFLQQSIGQYAYVWSNNSVKLEERNTQNEDSAASSFSGDVLHTDSLSFDKQDREQKIPAVQADKIAFVGGFLMSLLTQGINTLAAVTSDLVVNATQGMNTNDTDRSKKYSQFFVANTLSAAATDLRSRGISSAMASKVTAIKSLDMFYSTSSNSKCSAGAGFVNHNFVAQCVAQSVSNRYIEAQQNAMLTVLTPLSLLELYAKNLALKIIDDVLEKTNNILGSASLPTFVGTGGGSLIMAVASAVVVGLTSITKTLIKKNDFFIEYLPKLVECFKLSNGASFSQLGAINEHRIDIESKHTYGSKNVSFFWPCYGASDTKYTNEAVQAVIEPVSIDLDFSTQQLLPGVTSSKKSVVNISADTLDNVTSTANVAFTKDLTGKLTSEHIYCKGVSKVVNAPDDMAVIEGVDTFLPPIPFKNENISTGDPVFTRPMTQDYVFNKLWQLSVSALDGEILWVSCKDTKIIDGAYSNIVISDDFCGVASPYTAIEIKPSIDKRYIRPYAVTPNTIALNNSGVNCIHDNKIYHAFDGVGNRIIEWHGASGMDKQHLVYQYAFEICDHFKTSNIMPPNQVLGNFTSAPLLAFKSRGDIYNNIQVTATGDGIMNDTPGENKNLPRYALPVFTECISTLPAVVKTLSAYKLNVVEGITSLTTDLRSTQFAYKAPKSVDFSINGKTFRATDEFVCALNVLNGVTTVQDTVATMGLEYIGATPTQAFFYSQATRSYYVFTGANNVIKQDTWNRFRDITDGYWDFVNQEIVFDCLANQTRLDFHVHDDDDETDNIVICRMGNDGLKGDMTPPNTTLFNTRSWFKLLSMPGGFCYQGPKRFAVNRNVLLSHMIPDINANRLAYKRISKEDFHPVREYEGKYTSFDDSSVYATKGWVHNPFVFVTSPMGVSEDVDCLFEWEITFTWTEEMDKLYTGKKCMCINVAAQTMTPGGKLVTRPTHLYLTKEHFTRNVNSGYYSFRFNSNNGAGNREQLFIWSDSYIAMCGLQLEYKPITEKRNMPMTQQIDVHGYEEM